MKDYKKVLGIGLPVVLEMISTLVLGLIDTAFIGHLGAEALTAVGLAFKVLMVTTTLFMVMTIGSSILLSRFWGQKDYLGFRRCMNTFFTADFLMGIFFGVLWIVFAGQILRMMGGSDSIVNLGSNYVRALGLIGMIGSFVYVPSVAFKSMGKTSLTLLIAIVINLTNLIFDYLLIFGHLGFPALGVTGAGIATFLGHVSGGALAMILYWKSPHIEMFSLRGILKPDRKLLKEMFSLGFPASIEFLIYHLGQLLLIRLTTSIDIGATALFQIISKIMGISYMAAFGMGTAALTLVGQSLGRDNLKEALRMGKVSNRISIIFACVVGGLFLFFPATFLSLMTNDASLIQRGIFLMRLAAVILIPQAVNITLGQALQARGQTKWLMMTTAIGTSLMILFAYGSTIYFGTGISIIFLCIGLDEGGRALANRIRFST